MLEGVGHAVHVGELFAEVLFLETAPEVVLAGADHLVGTLLDHRLVALGRRHARGLLVGLAVGLFGDVLRNLLGDRVGVGLGGLLLPEDGHVAVASEFDAGLQGVLVAVGRAVDDQILFVDVVAHLAHLLGDLLDGLLVHDPVIGLEGPVVLGAQIIGVGPVVEGQLLLGDLVALDLVGELLESGLRLGRPVAPVLQVAVFELLDLLQAVDVGLAAELVLQDLLRGPLGVLAVFPDDLLGALLEVLLELLGLVELLDRVAAEAFGSEVLEVAADFAHVLSEDAQAVLDIADGLGGEGGAVGRELRMVVGDELGGILQRRTPKLLGRELDGDGLDAHEERLPGSARVDRVVDHVEHVLGNLDGGQGRLGPAEGQDAQAHAGPESAVVLEPLLCLDAGLGERHHQVGCKAHLLDRLGLGVGAGDLARDEVQEGVAGQPGQSGIVAEAVVVAVQQHLAEAVHGSDVLEQVVAEDVVLDVDQVVRDRVVGLSRHRVQAVFAQRLAGEPDLLVGLVEFLVPEELHVQVDLAAGGRIQQGARIDDAVGAVVPEHFLDEHLDFDFVDHLLIAHPLGLAAGVVREFGVPFAGQRFGVEHGLPRIGHHARQFVLLLVPVDEGQGGRGDAGGVGLAVVHDLQIAGMPGRVVTLDVAADERVGLEDETHVEAQDGQFPGHLVLVRVGGLHVEGVDGIFARLADLLVFLVDDGIPEARLLRPFQGDGIGLVDGGLDLGFFAHTDYLEGEALLVFVVGREGEVRLEEDDASVLDLEDHFLDQGAVDGAEGKGDGALPDIVLGRVGDLDARRAVAGRHPGSQDLDVIDFGDFDLRGQVLALDAFALGGDLLDARPDDPGRVADNQGVAELLVDVHFVGARLLGFFLLLALVPAFIFLVLLDLVRHGLDNLADEAQQAQGDGSRNHPRRELHSFILARGQNRRLDDLEIAPVGEALVEIERGDGVRAPLDLVVPVVFEGELDDHESIVLELQALVPGIVVESELRGRDIPDGLVPFLVPVILFERIFDLVLEVPEGSIEIVAELLRARTVGQEAADGVVVQGVAVGLDSGHDPDVEGVFERFAQAHQGVFADGLDVEGFVVVECFETHEDFVLLAHLDILLGRRPGKRQAVHVVVGPLDVPADVHAYRPVAGFLDLLLIPVVDFLGVLLGILSVETPAVRGDAAAAAAAAAHHLRNAVDDVELQTSVRDRRYTRIAAVRTVSVDQDLPLFQGPMAAFLRRTRRPRQQKSAQDETDKRADGWFH